MALTPQQQDAEGRRSKEEERRNRDLEWREALRTEDLNWRTTGRKEDWAWRQAVRAADLEYREREVEWRSVEARRADRRFALLAAAQSLETGSKVKDVLTLAARYAAWIESPDDVETR
jgi:hypothetical protein